MVTSNISENENRICVYNKDDGWKYQDTGEDVGSLEFLTISLSNEVKAGRHILANMRDQDDIQPMRITCLENTFSRLTEAQMWLSRAVDLDPKKTE